MLGDGNLVCGSGQGCRKETTRVSPQGPFGEGTLRWMFPCPFSSRNREGNTRKDIC